MHISCNTFFQFALSYRDLCNIHCVLDVGTRQCQWSSNSHPMAATRVEGFFLFLIEMNTQ